MTPEHAWTHEIPNADAQSKYTIEIQDAKGTTLLRQTEGEYDWTPASEIKVGPQPGYRIPDPDKRSFDDWIQFGKEEELNGRLLSAVDIYRQTLAKFPDSFVAGKAAGRLAAGLLRFEEAKNLLEPLHLRDTTDTEISYYLGIAYDGLEMPFMRARHTNRRNGCHRFSQRRPSDSANYLRERAIWATPSGISQRQPGNSKRPSDIGRACGRQECCRKNRRCSQAGARKDGAFPAQLPSSR